MNKQLPEANGLSAMNEERTLLRALYLNQRGASHQRCYVFRMLLMAYVMKWPVRLPNLKMNTADPHIRYRGKAW